jgi:uncharacterized surface protein with fasciclin (FAS1) repeats
MCRLLQQSDWDWQYSPQRNENWTVFVPTDRAFEALSRKYPSLLEYPSDATLQDLVGFHLVKGQRIISTDLQCSERILMSNGKHSRTVCLPYSTEIFQKGGDNGPDDTDNSLLDPEIMPKIIITDLEACNGILHILNGVMLSEGILTEMDVQNNSDNSSPTDPPVDVAAETDPPVTRAPTAVAPTPPPTPPPTTLFFPRPTVTNAPFLPAPDCTTIIDFVCGSRVLFTFCELIRKYNLQDDLAEANEITLFAPYNQAFGEIDLSSLPFDRVNEVLVFHATAQTITSGELECQALLEMVGGETRTYCGSGFDKYQKGAGNSLQKMPRLLVQNNRVCNGMVHIVDRVLLPWEL